VARKGLVRIQKETDRTRGTHALEMAERETCQDTEKSEQARGTHFLKTAEGGTSQKTERRRPNGRHSRSGDSRGRDLSGHGKKGTKRGALTLWRQQRDRLIRTQKRTERARSTHLLERTEEGTLSEYGMKVTERGALTNWGRQREGLVRTHK
jgi:hypothetical protein